MGSNGILWTFECNIGMSLLFTCENLDFHYITMIILQTCHSDVLNLLPQDHTVISLSKMYRVDKTQTQASLLLRLNDALELRPSDCFQEVAYHQVGLQNLFEAIL